MRRRQGRNTGKTFSNIIPQIFNMLLAHLFLYLYVGGHRWRWEDHYFPSSILCAFHCVYIFSFVPWMIPLQSQDEIKKQLAFDEKPKLRNNERIYIKDASLAPEKQFEPWISRDSADRVMSSKSERHFSH